jgi:hypothetical protein
MGFKREPKMKTTEPSDDEVGKGMKRGGHAHKKHMAMGGALPMGAAPMPMGRRPMPSARPDPRAAMLQAAMAGRGAPMMRKKGGEVESKAMEAKEEREIKGIKKELKHHESEKAGKAHHGLKRGGMAHPMPGGLLGGIEATRPDSKRVTGGVEGPGYKHGGKVHRVSGHPEGSHEHHMHMAKHHAKMHKEGGSAHHKKMHEHHKAMCEGGKMAVGGKVKEYAETKVVGAKQAKGFHTKTSGVEGIGKHKMAYARGGSVKSYENTELHGGPKMPTKPAGTKGIKEAPAGYAHGGHVAHHKAKHHHAEGGHIHMHEHSAKHAHGHEKADHHPMKKGGHVMHKAKGGICNY